MIVSPAFTVEGDAFLFTWKAAGRRLTIENHREAFGEFKAEMIAEMQTADGTWGTLHWGQHSLANTRSRGECAQAANRKDDAFDWHDAVTTACVLAVREWRRGEPVVELHTVQESESPRYLLWPYLPLNQTSILFGDGGGGKSLFASVLELGVLTGTAWPGVKAPDVVGPVLLLDYETTAEEQHRRIAKLGNGSGVPAGFHYRECHRPITEDLGLIRREVDRLAIKLVVIDSLAPACGDDVGKPGVAIATMNAIRSLGVTRLIVAHVTKADALSSGGSLPATIFGSAFFGNLARNTWELRSGALEAEEGTNPIALYHRKSNNDALCKRPFGYKFTFTDEHVTLEKHEINAESVLSGTLKLSDRIRQALAKGALDTTELSEELGVDTNTLRPTLHRMGDVQNLASPSGGRGKPARWGLKAHEDGPRKWGDWCSRCSARVECYGPTGIPYCEAHRPEAS